MRRTTSVWMTAVGILVGATTAVADDPAVIENLALRLEIGRSPAPYIARLVHKPSGTVVVETPAGASLFSIVLSDAAGQNTIGSASSRKSEVKVDKGDGKSRVSIRYADFPEADLRVDVRVTCADDDPFTRWSMTIDNPTGRRITAVRFPQVQAVPAIGAGKDDFLVLPALPGTLIENPGENWTKGRSVRLTYPGQLSAQFLTYQDRTAGVYLAGSDREGHPMALGVTRSADGFSIEHEFTPVADAENRADGVPYCGTRWQSPYGIALGVTEGTWCDSADRYKRWAVRQPWCAKTLVERADIPNWWKQGPDVHVVAVRTYDDKRYCNGSYYPKLLEHLRVYRDKIDGPVVAMLSGWENHRRWTAGDYFPVFDHDEAAKVIPQLKQAGFRPFFFLSGLYFTYENEGRDGSKIPAAAEYLPSYVVDQATGKPKEYVLNESSPSGEWKRHSYQFCVGSQQTGDFFCRVVDRAQELGVDVLQMDQTVQGSGDVCYATDHGHAPGAGLYQSQEFWKILDRMRQRGKSRSADFVLFHEEPHEQLIPHLDGFHVRDYYEKSWYRGYPGSVGIPLFSYLYHEYAIGYGGDSAGLNKYNSRWLVRAHAINLVAGRTPGGSIWSSHQSMFDAHPDQIAIIRNHCRLLKTRAGDFLMLGTMLHPFELDVPMLSIGTPGRGGKPGDEIATPAIVTSSWRSPAGRIGHVFVNLSETPQQLDVDIDTRNGENVGQYDVDVYRSSNDEGFKPLWQKIELPKRLSAELAPTDVVFVELRPL